MVVYHLDEVLYQGLTEQYGNRNLRRTEINLASSGADKYSLVTKKRLKTKAKCISSHVQVYVVELLKVHIEIESFVFFSFESLAFVLSKNGGFGGGGKGSKINKFAILLINGGKGGYGGGGTPLFLGCSFCGLTYSGLYIFIPY